MMLEVSLDTLKRNEINAHQFLISKLIYEQKLGILEDYLKSTTSMDNIEEDLRYLNSKGLITRYSTNPKDFQFLKATTKFIKEMSDGDFFEELYNTYPVKVTRKNGVVDYLRTDRVHCETLYNMITHGNKSKHDHIMQCLRDEIDFRTRDGSLGYMKRLSNWLVSREWKSFEDRIADSGNVLLNGEKAYGTELE